MGAGINAKAESPAGLSAAVLAKKIRQGELSVREVVEAHIYRIEQVNPALNAVVIPLFDEARRAAVEADRARARGLPLGPLHGVPVTIKEQFLVAGTDTTLGLPHQVGKPYPHDGPLVSKLRRAGAIILGKTNVPQLLATWETDSPVYGRANNPWNLDRSPGGSSGGEAAIIAAGGSPLGLGGDLGGSIRIPAHFCGICGLKPTAGRLTNADTPIRFVDAGQQAIVPQPGPMARTVADLQLAMEVLAAAGTQATPDVTPPVPWPNPDAIRVEGLRIGFFTHSNFFAVSPALRRAVKEAGQALSRLGAQVEPFTPPNLAEAVRLFLAIFTAAGSQTKLKAALAGAKPHRLVKGVIQGATMPRWMRAPAAKIAMQQKQQYLALLLRSTGGRSAGEYWRLVEQQADYRAGFLEAMNRGGFDALICPPFALPAVTHSATEHLFAAGGYTVLYNVLGTPAGVAPVTRVGPDEESDRPASRDFAVRAARQVEQSSAGLPVGVQVVARHWREDVVLAVMAALERHFRELPAYPCGPPG